MKLPLLEPGTGDENSSEDWEHCGWKLAWALDELVFWCWLLWSSSLLYIIVKRVFQEINKSIITTVIFFTNTESVIPELQTRVTKPSYVLWRHKPSY